MKTNEIFVLTACISVIHVQCKSQSELLITEKTDSIVPPVSNSYSNTFKLLAGGLNALYSNDNAKGGIDFSVETYHFYLVTGNRNLTDSSRNQQTKSNSNLSMKQQYKGFEFFLINRASVDFDSMRTLANDYITSLQASPITVRFVKEFFLTDQKEITASSYSPVISIRLTSDGRVVPYSDFRNKVNVGASGHFFVTLSTQFTRLEFDPKGKELDRGTMYLRPSFGFAVGSKELMKSVHVDNTNKVLLSTECRLGFVSHTKTVNDCSFLVRYTPGDVVGPKLRAGIILSSFN